MLDAREFVESCLHEIRVVQHLARKVLPTAYDWRPTPKQRSTIELMRYLTTCAIVPMKALEAGNWDHAVPMESASQSVTPATFHAAMDKQGAQILTFMAALSESDLANRDAVMPWGTPVKLGRGLVDVGLKTLVAYRMQLFLYAKISGNADLGPADCWVGPITARPPASPAANN